MTSTEEMEDEETAGFCLKSGTDKFVSRTQDVFASLGALEDKHSAFLKATAASREKEGLIKNDPDDGDERNADAARERSIRDARSRLSETRDSDYERRSQSRSRERDTINRVGQKTDDRRGNANFRRPNHPPVRSGRQPVPDFKRHPEKYTCYTLADVSGKDMSERSNQKAAFAFLEERRLEREKQERLAAGLPEEEPKFDASVAACSQGKITFSRPRNRKELHESDMGDSVEERHFSKSLPGELDSDVGENEDVILSDRKMGGTDVSDSKVGDTIDNENHRDNNTDIAANENVSSSFKARKNVKRHIRRKNSDEDSE